jgi:hypothetical protein
MVMLAGQEMVGGVMSRTVIVRLQTAVFPQSSVAVQVRVVLYVPAQLPCNVVSAEVTSTNKSQASVAVAVRNTGVAGQFTGVTCDTQVIVGAVLSRTVIVRLQTAVFPQSSVPFHVRVTLYVPAQLPCNVVSAKAISTDTSQASVAVAVMNIGVAGQFTGVTCDTQVIVGAVLSRTVIVRLQTAVFPQSSVAFHVRVTLYVPAQLPCNVVSAKVILTDPSQASVAVAVRNTGVAGQFTGVT